MSETTELTAPGVPDPWDYEDETRPSAFIQWKGTDVCMDFYCPCGAQGHFDGEFAYFVRCPHCNRVFEMGYQIGAREVTEENASNPKVLGADRDVTGGPLNFPLHPDWSGYDL